MLSGLYLVNYDEKNWHLLIDFLHKPMFHRIPHLNRVHLINNAANLAWIGRLDYAIFLDMLKYLIHEPYDHPKYAAVRWMEDLNALLKRTPVHDMFLNYVNDILQNDLEDVASKFTAKIMNKYPKFMKIQQRSTFSHIVDS